MKTPDKNYKLKYFILLCVQAVFILICLGNTLAQIISPAKNMTYVPSGYYVSYLLNMLICFWVIIYAFWGYNHSIVPYRIALTTYIISAMVKLVRLIDGGMQETWMKPTAYLLALGILLTIIYDNTFKRYKKPALVFGVLLVLTELARGIIYVAYSVGNGEDSGAILAEQPFAAFLAVSALVASYAARTHWSLGGKVDLFEDEEEEEEEEDGEE